MGPNPGPHLAFSTGQGSVYRLCSSVWALELPVYLGWVWGRCFGASRRGDACACSWAGGPQRRDGTQVHQGWCVMGTVRLALPLSLFFTVCVLIENLSLSKMPLAGDAVIGKCCPSSMTHAVAFSSGTTHNYKIKVSLLGGVIRRGWCRGIKYVSLKH